MPDSVRIAVIDDHPLFRQGVVSILTTEPGFEVVGEGANSDDAVRLAQELSPNIILLDISMSGGGIQAAEVISSKCPDVKIVMLTVSEDEENVFAALKTGARGYLLKGVSGPELIRIVHSINEGQLYVPPGLAAGILGTGLEQSDEVETTEDPLSLLTVREREILQLVSTGQSNKEVARTLNLSEKTVKYYMSNILHKLQVRNRVEAALLTQKAGG